MFVKPGSVKPVFREVLAWVQRICKNLFNSLVSIIKHTPGLGPYLQGAHKRYLEISWENKVINVKRDVESLIPEDATFILIDEGNFIGTRFSQRQPIAFLERDGQYWGAPTNDDEAIRALEQLRQHGATFMVVLWPAFWWLEYYKEWNQYIRSRFHCIGQNERIIVFDLREPCFYD